MDHVGQGLSRSPTRNLRFVRGEWFAIGLMAVAVLGAGCSAKAQVGYIRQARTGIAPEEAVAVILDGFSGEFSAEKEIEFAGCIGDAIRKAHPARRIIPPDEFRRTAFPDLTAEQVPPQPWDELVKGDDFRLLTRHNTS